MKSDVHLYPAMDVFESIAKFKREHGRCNCAMLDPWYNKGVGGVRDDYVPYISSILEALAEVSDQIYLWGFPEIVANFMGKLPTGHQYIAWLTWYYKNNPSVIRGWRSAQNACLHMGMPNVKLYPEHFLNEVQKERLKNGKLRYIPGPTSVIEAPLNIGFIGRKEQTGHPAQKPLSVYEKLIRMATAPGDMVFDPMCGSGTTGIVCRVLNRNAVLSEVNPAYVEITASRLSNFNHDAILQKHLAL